MKKLISAVSLGMAFVIAVLWLLGAGLTPVAKAQGGTGFVRVATTGTDTPGCGSIALPCATVQFAVNEALPGDTVILSAGTWNESVTLSQPISLTGVSSATSIIQAVSGQRALTVTGAAINSSVIISGLTFTGGDVSGGNVCFSGDPTNCGGGILLTGNAQPTIQNVIIENNSAHVGGGLYANETGGLILDRVVIRNNTAILAGGGLRAPNTPITVTNSLFQQNSSSFNVGGGLAAGANSGIVAPLLISNTTFINNSATCQTSTGICHGGGVYAFDLPVTIVNSRFENNSVQDLFDNNDGNGGGLYLARSFNVVTLTLVNTDFISNSAPVNGGGVYANNQAFITGGRFERNFAGGQDTAFSDGGGGLWALSAVVNGAQFIQNSSNEDGAGLHVRFNADVTDAQFQFNQAITNGGGIYVDFAGALALTNTQFISNTAGMNGGGAYASSNAQLTGGRFERNRANGPENNGGLLTTQNGGGGLWVGNNLTLADTQFISNVAQTNGGGAHVRGAAALNSGQFEQNLSLGSFAFLQSYGGGGLYAANTLAFTGTIFSGNQAAFLGGGVWAGQDVSGSNGLFQNNTAGRNAGGVFTLNDLTLAGTQFINNQADLTGGGALVGGVANLTNALFQANRVISTSLATNGGGLAASDGFTATNTQFTGNTSTGSGAGASTFGPVTLFNSLFQNNQSDVNGGGLASGFDPVDLRNTSFINNTAGASGGGVAASGNILLTDSLIQNNNATTNGGGLNTSGSVFITDTTIISNTAAGDGGGIWANSRLTGINGRIQNNTAGGSGGGYYGGLGQLFVNGTEFSGNQAGMDGGGAYAFDGRAIGNALFEENTATGAGGGLFLQRFVAITTTRFLGNDATLGGGMAISRTNTGTAIQFVHNSLFARNTATANGAGIYWNQPRPINLIHNTIAAPNLTGGAAIHVVTGTVNITNNIIANHATGIQVIDGAVTENYNLFSGNTTNTSGPMSGGFGSLTGNPAFQNPAADDYHLTNASQAINLGTDAGITTDFENDPRPGIGGFDVGFDETAFAPVLLVSKTATPANNAPYQGEIIYTVVLSNTGDLDAINTLLTDTLPAQVDFDRFIQANGATVLNDEITWTGNVPVNTSLTFSFVVSHTGNYGDVFTNTVTVGHTAITGNITASATVVVEPQVADLLISKSSVRDEDAGVISYTVMVQNLGPHDAGGVAVSDPIPAGISAFSWQCAAAGGATCTANGAGNINDTLTSFPVGGQVVYTIQATMANTGATIVNTATLLLPPGLTNTAPTNSAINTSAPAGNIYLPIVLSGAGGGGDGGPTAPPDLIVDSIIAGSNTVTVTIKNIGSGPVVDAFWVDVYIDPTTPPTGVNQRWQDVGSQGLVWGVVAPALPIAANGGTLTLTLNDAYYFANLSTFNPPLAVGTPVYAQVDSVNLNTNYGGVLEDHEANGGAYNNINSTLSVLGLSESAALSTADNAPSIPAAPLPQRE